MYGMRRTTVYLPARLKAAVKRAAEVSGTSEANVIRSALERATEAAAPRPTVPLFRSRHSRLAERVDAALAGKAGTSFGER
jgi:hypothetical protein